MAYIYILTNLKNSKQYIGQAVSLKKRIRFHIWESKHNPQKPLHRAIKKYGIEKFKIIPIECPNEELNEWESFWIKTLNTKKPNGYNLTDGGEGLKNPTKEIKQKISKSKIGHEVSLETRSIISTSLSCFYKNNPNHKAKENHHFWGKKQSEESNKKRSLKLKGRKPWNAGKKMTEEQKKAHYGHTAWNKGIPQTSEAKEKNKLAHLGKKMSEKTKQVHSIQTKKMWEKKEFKEKMKKIFKQLWETPEFREKNLEARKRRRK